MEAHKPEHPRRFGYVGAPPPAAQIARWTSVVTNVGERLTAVGFPF